MINIIKRTSVFASGAGTRTKGGVVFYAQNTQTALLVVPYYCSTEVVT